MTGPTILIVLVSCFLHAGWNLLARGQRRETEFFWRMLFVTVLAGAIPALASELLSRSLNTKAWLCVLGSGTCCGVYYFAMARAYARSDFTVVYPIARSLPVLIVAVLDVLRGRLLTPLGWLGAVLVVCGCLLAPLHTFRDFRFRHYFNHAVGWMVLTAAGTVGYTFLDKIAAETVAPSSFTAARYGFFFFAVAFFIYGLLVKLSKTEDEGEGSAGWWAPTFGAMLNFGAYWLVLWAYQLTQRASYIVAFRQFSVTIGVVIAFAVFKEQGLAVRLTGAVLITAGLVVIGVWG